MDVLVESRKTSPAAEKYRPAGGEIYFAIGESSLGLVLVARSRRGACAVLMGDDSQELRRGLKVRFPNSELIEGDSGAKTLCGETISFIESPDHDLDVPLDLRGTDFQQVVWQALREIPAGKTVSYTEVAHRIGRPTAVRAVAKACAANALAIFIPCHRVVRSDGSLSGYRWGIERKRALLDREAKPALMLRPR